MNRRCIVYGLVDPTIGDIRYVGQTTMAPRKRLQAHIRDSREPKLPVQFWIRKVIEAGGNVEMVMLNDAAIWNETEIETIARLRVDGARLLNVLDGGEGALGHKATLEWREAQAARTKAWWDSRLDRTQPPWTEEHKLNHQKACEARGQGAHWRGAKHSEETKARMRAAWALRKQKGTSAQTRENMKASWTPERRAAASAAALKMGFGNAIRP